MDNGFITNPLRSKTCGFTLPYGFWADLWGSTDFRGAENLAREVDYGLGWSDGQNIDVGVFYFDFAKLFSDEEYGDVIRPHVELFKSFSLNDSHNLTPYVRLEYLIATYMTGDNSALFGLHGPAT